MAQNSNLVSDAELTIASFLPLKYLRRLQPFSTTWNSIITSDPVFALTHLRNSNSSSNHFLRQYQAGMGDTWGDYGHVCFSIEIFQDGELKSEDVAFPRPEGCNVVLCNCNGLLLLADLWYRPTKYVLWNPSIGRKLDCHFPRQLYSDASYGICYDPVVHDFKLVFISRRDNDDGVWSYGVFSFKKNSWTEETELPYRGSGPGLSLYVDGALYWNWEDAKTTHLVYFDPRSDEFKTLEKPKGLPEDDRLLFLACMNGDLYLYCNAGDESTVQIWVKEKGIFENCWKEFATIENVETRIYSFRPLCLMGGKNKVKMVVELEGERYVMYRFDEKTFEQVEEFIEKRYACPYLIPYQESLLFPTPETMHPQQQQGNN